MHSWQGKQIKVNILFSRAGVAQHIWVSNENGAILVDTGDGILRDLLSNGLDFNRLNGLIFTHGHFDHVGGLHSLLGYLRMIGRKPALPIFAPKGCTELFSLLDNFMHCYGNTIPFQIDKKELEPHEVFEIAEMRVEPYPVVHCGGIKDTAILEATLEKSEGANKELLEKVHLSEDLANEVGKLAKDFILIHKGRRKGKIQINRKD